MNVEITHITILLTDGTDEIQLHTTLPEAVYPFKRNAILRMEVQYDKGEEYCKQYFPNIPIKNIKNIRY